MRKPFAALAAILLGVSPVLADAFSDQYTGMVGRIPLLTSPFRATDYLSAVRNGIPYKIPVFDAASGGTVPPNPTDPQFGAKCDIQIFDGGATWSAGASAYTPGNSITPTSADTGKKLLVQGAGAGGASYAGTITGVSGTAWAVSPALTQASGLTQVYGVVVATPQSGAGSYAPGNTITLTGGTTTGGSQPVLTVKYTKVVSATIAAAGSGGANGTRIVTGTTGRGQYFQASVTVAGGIITAVGSITVAGAYFTNPTSLTNEPVTGAELAGAQLSLKMGVAQVIPTSPGGYSVAPSNPVAQGSTSGSGTGATFTLQTALQNYGYGWWYYGTDDAVALQSGVTWAGSNQATLQLLPKQWCGTSATLTMTDSLATLTGNSSGVTEANRTFANTPYNSGLFWLGGAGDPIVQIATPDATPRLLGNSVQRLALICGNRAGYALQLKSVYGGEFSDLYTQQCTNAAIEITTNTNATSPTDTNKVHFSDGYINQESSNGVGLRVTGDPSVGTGDSSGLSFDNIAGWVGNDTWMELLYADSNVFNNLLPFHAGFAGALYDFDFSGVPSPGFYTYGNRINFGAGTLIVRGTDSSGTSAASTRNTYSVFGDPVADPIEGPGSQLEFRDAYLQNNKILTGRLLSGIRLGPGLYNDRDILNNTTSSALLEDPAINGGTPRGLMFNVVFDNIKGYRYLANGPAFFLRNDNTSHMSLLGAPAGLAGNHLTSFPDVFIVDALTGTTVSNGLSITSSYPGTTKSLDVINDITLGTFAGWNLYFDLINGYTYHNTGFGWALRADPTGVFQILSAASGTGGTAATATSKVQIAQDGLIDTDGGLSLAHKLVISKTAPTIASGGCTTGSAQSISASNGTAAFTITLGGATCGSGIVLTMPAATAGWVCDARDLTAPDSNVVEQVASATNAATLRNYVRTTGVTGNFTGADVLAVKCVAY